MPPSYHIKFPFATRIGPQSALGLLRGVLRIAMLWVRVQVDNRSRPFDLIFLDEAQDVNLVTLNVRTHAVLHDWGWQAAFP